MNTTPIIELESLADGMPVMAVQAEVAYAEKIKTGQARSGTQWSRQFFVLKDPTGEIGVTMWDAEGNEMKKGEHVTIENTQNKKGQWSGMTKESYQKNGERKHALSIRANQVKISSRQAEQTPASPVESPKQAEQPKTAENKPNEDTGILETRKHLMQSVNLYNLCLDAADTVVRPHLKQMYSDHPEITSEQFWQVVGQIYKEASNKRTNDGVNWWSFIDKMPEHPIK